MVTDVSAKFVDRIHFLTPSGATSKTYDKSNIRILFPAQPQTTYYAKLK